MKLLSIIILALIWAPMAMSQNYPLMRVLQKDFPENTGPLFFPACGVGSAIFDSYSWISSAPASTTNTAFSSAAPISTTLNQSECKGPKKLVDNQPEIIKFAQENLDVIGEQIANGKGESLDTLAELMAIPTETRGKWRSNLQENFALIFPAPTVDAAFVIDQILTVSHKDGIDSPYARNIEIQELF